MRLVLLGGGHSHIEVLRRLPDFARSTRVTLVSPASLTPYSGMLPGAIAGHYTIHDSHIDLDGLACAAGARFVRACATRIDAARQCVLLDDGESIDYDVLSLDIGSTSSASRVAGAEEIALDMKPAGGILERSAALLSRVASGEVRDISVIGAGAAGIEVLLALHRRGLTASVPQTPSLRFTLHDAGMHILPGYPSRARKVVSRILCERSIDVRLGDGIARIEACGLLSTRGQWFPADAIVWTGGPAAPPLLADSGLALDPSGFVAVNSGLQSTSHSSVFAAGDCASVIGHAYPKSGVYAVRQGPVLAQNLECALARKADLIEFRGQRRALSIITCGERYAVAAYGPVAAEGRWVWRWKDRIDRKFVARYRIAARSSTRA